MNIYIFFDYLTNNNFYISFSLKSAMQQFTQGHVYINMEPHHSIYTGIISMVRWDTTTQQSLNYSQYTLVDFSKLTQYSIQIFYIHIQYTAHTPKDITILISISYWA